MSHPVLLDHSCVFSNYRDSSLSQMKYLARNTHPYREHVTQMQLSGIFVMSRRTRHTRHTPHGDSEESCLAFAA